MSDASQPLTLALTGQLPFVLLAAAVLALPTSLLLLRLYRRAVLASMCARAPAAHPPQDAPCAPLPSPPAVRVPLAVRVTDPRELPAAGETGERLRRAAQSGPWRTAAVYALGGLTFALVLAAAFLASSGTPVLPFRLLVLTWSYAWPVAFTTVLVAALTRRARLLTLGGYFLGFAALGWVALVRSPDLTAGQIAVLWAVTNVPPTLLILAFLNRRVRAVGPLVLTLFVIGLVGALLAVELARSHEGTLRAIVSVAVSLGLGASSALAATLLAGLALFAPLGWLALRWVGHRYEARALSDQSVTIDTTYLLFAIVASVGLVFEGPAWFFSGAVAFAAYKLVVWASFRALEVGAPPAPVHPSENASRTGGRGSPNPVLRRNVRLLLLRVFALGRRSERMFDVVTTHWRYLGNARLITGPDLATTTVEPHEFLDFLSGKVSRLFIADPADLERRLAATDPRPDFDGRYRVHDFFCYDDTWEMVLSRLVADSDAVLMDLRGFSPANSGCVHELRELLNVMPLARVVLVSDATTDQPFLERTLQAAWQEMRTDSPNATGAPGEVRLVRLRSATASELQRLVGWLALAATETRPAGSRR